MKKLKKILAFMLAVVMTLALSGITAFADTTDSTGTITIKNATVGKTYTIYKIFDANPSGSNGLVAYTATEEQRNFFEGQENNPFEFEENIKGSYNVSKKANVTDEAVIEFLQSFYTEKTDEATQETTYVLNSGFAAVVTKGEDKLANNATVTFGNVSYGYYLVTSTLGAVITVDSTNTDATIIDKNQAGPEWDGNNKKIVEGEELVSVNSANYGDTINFKVQFKATNYVKEKEIDSYEIKDTMAKGLQLLDDPAMVVKVNDKILTENDDYTITKDIPNNKFTLKINWRAENDFKYTSPSDITVTYSAKVLDTAVIAGEGNKNTAKLIYYTVNPEDPTNPEPHDDFEESKTTTYVYALAINKTDGKGVALQGATFNLKDSKNNDVYVVPTDTAGVYNYSSSNAANATKDVVSPENGVIIVKGVDAGTYTLTETKAPAGYNVLKGTVEVTTSIDKTLTYTTTYTVYYDENGEVTNEVTETTSTVETNDVPVSLLTVVNKTGAELPSTGGIGTTIFYVIGGILVVSAGILLVAKRRMRGQL